MSQRRRVICPPHFLDPGEDLYSAASTPPLTAAREAELFARRAGAGEDERRQIDDEIVRANIRWATVECIRLSSNLPMATLRSAAVRGLAQALERYDPARGVRFLSYAVWWVKQSLHEEVREEIAGPVRLPQSVTVARRRLAEAYQARQEPASLDQMLDDIGCQGEARELLVAALAGPVWLDAPTLRSRNLAEVLPAPQEPEEDGWSDNLPAPADQIDAALGRLPERTRRVVSAYFGLDGQEARTCRQIAAELGVTWQRVHQIKDAGLEQLRGMLMRRHGELRAAVRAARAAAARPEAN